MFEKNNDQALVAQVAEVRKARARAGLKGMTGDLEAVVIATEPDLFAPAVEELLATTGHHPRAVCRGQGQDVCVLSLPGSADMLVTARKAGPNPFEQANRGAKTQAKPNTRLETFIYSCRDVRRYFKIQQNLGVAFLQDEVVETPAYRYVQTWPSAYTGNSLGFIEWRGGDRDFCPPGCDPAGQPFVKPAAAHLGNIGRLDHVAVRVKAEERDLAILEFMALTSYDFAFAVYVEQLNSITNVARLSPAAYAQVFTSGIAPFVSPETSGPTELFIHNYGARGHHMAFETVAIEDTVAGLQACGMGFLSGLVGSRTEGLKQVFSKMSGNTLLVNEYIQRYDGFDGFFTKSNVTLLTDSTRNQ